MRLGSARGTALNPTPGVPRTHTLLDGWAACTNEVPLFQNGSTISGVTGCNFRKQLRITGPQNITIVRLVYANFITNDNPGPNTLTVSARMEQGFSPWRTVTFGGALSKAIEPGGFIISDPIVVRPAVRDYSPGDGQFITLRTFVSPATGGIVPCNYYSAQYEDRIDTTQTDVTGSSTFGTTGAHWGYGPIAILGNGNPTQLMAFFGDSIMYGLGDFPNHRGWAVQWAIRDEFPYVKVGMPSESAQNFSGLQYSTQRLTLTQGSSVAVCQYGVNDGYGPPANTTAAKTSLQAIWQDLANRGMRVYQTTITPVTTSTDSWTTVGNQTVDPLRFTATQLTDINTWIRSKPAPLAGYIDMADMTMTARNSSIWQAGMTNDGIHPNETGHAAIAAAMPKFRTL